MAPDWKQDARLFFDARARTLGPRPSLADHCFVSGRDPRLWSETELYDDLMRDIVQRCEITNASSTIEIGCASGFLARGVAPYARRFVGIDVAPAAIEAAALLDLPNAEFRVADGAATDFREGEFDSAYCYDVITNFPDLADFGGILREMMRIVRPGGAVLIGSIPERDRITPYEAHVATVAASLMERYGPPPDRFLAAGEGSIVCYYFSRDEFRRLAGEVGAAIEFLPLHAGNPYRDFRFNAVLRKPEGCAR